MLSIIALVLAIPTYGVSLLILFLFMIYRAKRVKSNLQKAIVYLSKNESIIGTCFKEISYQHAHAYASELGVMTYQSGPYIEFEVQIDEKSYAVTLNREPNGNGAVLTAKNFDWVKNVYSWFVKYMGHHNLPMTSKIPSLTWIQLGSVTLGGRDIQEIPVDLCKIKTLEQLCLQFNQIESLPEEIGDLINLKDFKLGGNRLKTLPRSIGNLEKLEILTVWWNDLIKVPPEIGQLKNLRGLSFWGNPLASLPEEIANLTQLRELELYRMPNLVLSLNQKAWIKKLAENGCNVLLDDSQGILVTEKSVDKINTKVELFPDLDDDIPF